MDIDSSDRVNRFFICFNQRVEFKVFWLLSELAQVSKMGISDKRDFLLLKSLN